MTSRPVDFTKHTDEELRQALLQINRTRLPERFAAAEAELNRRKLLPAETLKEGSALAVPGIFRRVLAYVLDEAMLYVGLGLLLQFAMVLTPGVTWDAYFQPVLAFVLEVAYFTWTEGRTGQSWMKRLLKLQVVRENGPRTYGFTALRTFLVLLLTDVAPAANDLWPPIGVAMFALVLTNVIFALLHAERRTLIDTWTRSAVIRVHSPRGNLRADFGPRFPRRAVQGAIVTAVVGLTLGVLNIALDRNEETPPQFAPKLSTTLGAPVLETSYLALQKGEGPVYLLLVVDLPLPDFVPPDPSPEVLDEIRTGLLAQADEVMRTMARVYEGRPVDGYRVNYTGKRRIGFFPTEVKLTFDRLKTELPGVPGLQK